MNGKEEDGTPFIVAVAELLARFKPYSDSRGGTPYQLYKVKLS